LPRIYAVAGGTGDRIGERVGTLVQMFPDVPRNGDFDLVVVEACVEVHDGGVPADTGGVKEILDGILRGLPTDDDLVAV